MNPVRHPAFASLLAAGLLAGAAAPRAHASEPASGEFVATQACEAFQSMRKRTNPGQVQVAVGTRYRVREVNGPDRGWVRLDVPGASGGLRWVEARCGRWTGAGAAGAGAPSDAARAGTPSDAGGTASRPATRPNARSNPRPPAGGSCSVAGQADSYVLAMSWQPGFCEHVAYQGRKPECDRMADGRLVVTHLTLHGLWPNRRDCGTRYGSCPGPALDLRPETVAHVRPWMPNFFYEQAFGRYEWSKHGTCTAMDDDTYFRRAVDAVQTFDRSAAGRYLAAHAGRSISQQVFQDHLRRETGRADAPNAVTLLCTNQQLYEVRVQLPVDFREGGTLDAMLGPTLPTRAPSGGKVCRGDTVRVEASGP